MRVAEEPEGTSGPVGPDPPSGVETPIIALLTPADGLPPVLDTPAAVADAAARLAAGTGPLAVDAERASGFRYFSRAYLVQLRRAGCGTVLIDPIPLAGEFTALAAVINTLEWVLHAADQDLPGLAELGLAPARLFDTELGGRLAGFERVSLAAMVRQLLNTELRKGHGAADWSTRPLPTAWLEYAALDVELLLPLREAVAQTLREQGKTDWAAQEFESIRTLEPAGQKPDRWRRTSGIHTLRRPRQLAVVRELWTTRDRLARVRDVAAARVLPDSAIIAAAAALPESIAQLRALPVFGGPRQRRHSREWLAAVTQARMLPDSQLPTINQPYDGPPPINRWLRREPTAANRLTRARSAMNKLSQQYHIPVENLLTPDLLRRLCWHGLPEFDTGTVPDDPVATVDEFLRAGGARPWQRHLSAPALAPALFDSAPSDDTE